MLSQIIAACTALAALVCQSHRAAPGPGEHDDAPDELTSCRACRLDFMKCVASGADLGPDARKERKRACADAAAMCLQRCTRGAVMTEYLVVVGACAIVVAGAIASLGIPLLTGYGAARTVLIAPVP